MKDCTRGCDPQTDDTAIECDGNFTAEECVILKAYPYLNISEGDSLSTLHQMLILKLKSLTNQIGSWNSLVTADNDSQAQTLGVLIGKPYVTSNGFVKIRLS